MGNCFFYDGVTAQAHESYIKFENDFIYISFLNHSQKMISWDKNLVNDFYFNGNTLIIKYGDFPQQTLECTDKLASDFFDFLSYKGLTRKSKRFWLKNKTGFALISSVLFIGICFLAYFVFLPWIGEKSVKLIPLSVEVDLGNTISESILKSCTEEDSATYYANEFVSYLKTNSTYRIQINVIESDEINAFALPGGKIFIYSEIIKHLNTYEEFGALLGHEISHVNQQHSLKSICRTAASSMFIAAMFGDVTGVSAGIVDQANQFKQLNYSRELELEADNNGYDFMLQNKISPNGMIDLLILLKNETREMPDFMKYISTHPETDQRIKNIKSKKEVNEKYEDCVNLKVAFEKMKSHVD